MNARVSEVLTAAGNHEGKALTYLAMEPGTAYGVSSLHRRFLEIQGGSPVFTGTVNLQQKYCVYSFEPAGLTSRGESERGTMTHSLVQDPLDHAIVSAFLLATEARPFSLLQLWGKTAGPGDNRAPRTRLRLLEVLVHRTGPLSMSELARLVEVPESGLTGTVRGLRELGLLTGETIPTYEMKTAYRVRRSLTPERRQRRVAFLEVIGYLNARLAAAGGPFDVTRDEIEQHLTAQPRWRDLYVRDSLQRTMAGLVAAGKVESLHDHRGQREHSPVGLTAGARVWVPAFVEELVALGLGSRQMWEALSVRGQQLVENPARVRRLLAKGFGANKVLINPVSAADKERRVLAALSRADGRTTVELLIELAPDLNKAGLSGTLAALSQKGLVRGERLPQSPQKCWWLAG